MRAHMDAVFAEYDLVRSPVASTGPPRFDERVDPRDVAAAHVVLQDLLGLPASRCPTAPSSPARAAPTRSSSPRVAFR